MEADEVARDARVLKVFDLLADVDEKYVIVGTMLANVAVFIISICKLLC